MIKLMKVENEICSKQAVKNLAFYEDFENFLCVENVRLLQYPMCVTNTPDIKTSVHQTSYCQGSLLDVRKHFLTKGLSLFKSCC